MKAYSVICTLILLSSISIASLAEDYESDQNRALKLLSTCDSNKTMQPDSCIEGGKLWQATSSRLYKNVADGMEKRKEERQRVQQDEIWREQVRKQ